MKTLLKFKFFGKSILQKLVITIQMYGENNLANHASACAYGFLLSIAPMLLLIAFFIFIIFNPSPRAIIFLFGNLPFVGNLFDEHWLSSDFFSIGKLGISGLISILSIFWAGRILAVSVQRALTGIFPADKNRNPITNTLITLVITAVVFIFVLLFIFSSGPAVRFYRYYLSLAERRILNIISIIIGSRFFNVVLLGLISFFIFLLVPANSPRKFSALQGVLLFTITYSCVVKLLSVILDTSRYNFIYGTLGNLIFLLVNVYFFFILFFIGAQFAYVNDYFDALLFSKMRKVKLSADNFKRSKHLNLLVSLFNPLDSSLNKYLRQYKKDEIIFVKGDSGDEIYYILEGYVEILLSVDHDVCETIYVSAGILNTDSFFGEIGYLLSEDRTATIKAGTDVSVLVLPSALFDIILKYDNDLDRNIIENITRRLKDTTEQYVLLKTKEKDQLTQ